MKAEVVAEITRDIAADFDDLGIVRLMEALISALRELSSNQSDETQQKVKGAKEALLDELMRSRFHTYPVGLQVTLDEMEVIDFLPPKMYFRVKSAFEGNDITPAVVLVNLEKIKADADKLLQYAQEFSESGQFFEIYPDELETDEDFEFSIVIPRAAVQNELDDFGRELILLNKLFGVFTEVATGSRGDFKIKSISSSDLTVVLESAPAVAVLIATTFERVAAIYEKILNIIKLQKDLRTAQIPDKILNDMNAHIAATIKTELKEASKQVGENLIKKVETGRRNELRTELLKAFEGLAARLDRGYIFDVRGPAPEDVSDQNGEAAAVEAPSNKLRRIVAEKRELIKHFKAESEPVLSLAAPDDGDARSETVSQA